MKPFTFNELMKWNLSFSINQSMFGLNHHPSAFSHISLKAKLKSSSQFRMSNGNGLQSKGFFDFLQFTWNYLSKILIFRIDWKN